MAYPVIPLVPPGPFNLAELPAVTKVIEIKAQAITAGTAVDVYTPTTGKKFNILTYSLGVSATGAIIFEDGNTGLSAEILRTTTTATNATAQLGALGSGVPSGTANNHLFLDVTASATVNGWIGISEI